MMPLPVPDREKCDDTCVRLDRVPALDRETDKRRDGRICRNNIALCIQCMLRRDKNIIHVEMQALS